MANKLYLMVEMMFYIGNCCYFDLSASTVKKMRACRDFTIVSNMAILLVVWFAAIWGMKYPDNLKVCPVAMLHCRLVCRLTIAITGYRVRQWAGRAFGMSPRQAAWREGARSIAGVRRRGWIGRLRYWWICSTRVWLLFLRTSCHLRIVSTPSRCMIVWWHDACRSWPFRALESSWFLLLVS